MGALETVASETGDGAIAGKVYCATQRQPT
jgi:hypothetical protein